MNTGDSTWSVSENVFEQIRTEKAVFQDLIAFVPLSSMLSGVSPYDPLTFVAALAAVVCVSLAAAFIPAHRAASNDPMNALRSE